MKILLYNPDNGVTRNFMPHLWMFLLQALTPPGHEVILLDGNARAMTEEELVRFVREEGVGLAERDGVGMPEAAVSPERFVGLLGHMRSTHDDGDAGGADRVGDAVCLGDHPRHCPDADEADPPLAHEAHDLLVGHRARVPVEEQDLVPGRRERLEEEHPEVRHVVAGNPIVRAVEQNPHRA